jgi:hypothetical protein
MALNDHNARDTGSSNFCQGNFSKESVRIFHMAKPLRKAQEKLRKRQDEFDRLRGVKDGSKKRPGSMNRKKRL